MRKINVNYPCPECGKLLHFSGEVSESSSDLEGPDACTNKKCDYILTNKDTIAIQSLAYGDLIEDMMQEITYGKRMRAC